MIYYNFSDYQLAKEQKKHSALQRKVIVLLGNCLEFPNHNLEVVSTEMPGIDVFRLERLADVEILANQKHVNVVLLVVAQDRMHDLISTFARYKDAAPGARIVYAYEADPFAKEVYASAVGDSVSFLPMRCRIDTWTAYLRLLICGELVVPHLLVSATRQCEIEKADLIESEPRVKLTVRENEVLALVANGAGNREIASDIGISEHTVKLHLHNVFSKLDVPNRAGAVAWYVRNAK